MPWLTLFLATLKTEMPNGSNERVDRIEANLERLSGAVQKITTAVAVDGENILSIGAHCGGAPATD